MSSTGYEVHRMSDSEINDLAVSVHEDLCEAFYDSQLQEFLNAPLDDERGADCA